MICHYNLILKGLDTDINWKPVCNCKQLGNSNTKSLFYDARIKQARNKLQNDFAILRVDKANTNFAIICQKLYCDVLASELFTTNV